MKVRQLVKCVEKILKKWGLRNVSTIIVDNASSNDVVVIFLQRRIKNMNELILYGHYLHVKCCTHTLNLIVSDGLKMQTLEPLIKYELL